MCLVGNDEKLVVCKDHGANVCINYKMEDFVKRLKEVFGGKGIFSDIKTSLFCNSGFVKLKNMIYYFVKWSFS